MNHYKIEMSKQQQQILLSMWNRCYVSAAKTLAKDDFFYLEHWICQASKQDGEIVPHYSCLVTICVKKAYRKQRECSFNDHTALLEYKWGFFKAEILD